MGMIAITRFLTVCSQNLKQEAYASNFYFSEEKIYLNIPGIKKNEIYEMEISGMNHEGQGVGRIEGFTVFVDGAIPGETVHVRIIELKKNYAVGTLIKIIKPAPCRVTPFCKDFERCGGCSLQHMNYQAQLKLKAEIVGEDIKRIGKLAGVIIHDTIGMANPFRYRNKVQFPVGISDGKPVMGFYAKRSHEIVGNRFCSIQDKDSDLIRDMFLKFLKDFKISIYDEKTGKGLIRHLMVRKGFKTGEVMVVIVVNGNDLPHKVKLIERLKAAVAGIRSIYLNINTRNTNIILGEKNIKIYGHDTITDFIGRFRFEISPLSFFQVNPAQTEVLYRKALEYAHLKGNETVFDLYCGIGTISLFLSEKAGKVYGIEVVEDAVEDAKKNAAANGVHNVEFITGEVAKVIPGMHEKGISADVAVVDPPRKGCDEVVLETLVKMQPERIVYVSCNPSTLARDLNYLAERGYMPVEVQPVDMFPFTSHVECVVLMSRVKN